MNNKNIVDTRSLADKGRFGDEYLGYVDGRLSHINADEMEKKKDVAQLDIPQAVQGKLRELVDDDIKLRGSGTTNPDTGLPEYFDFANFFGKMADYKPETSSIFKGGKNIVETISSLSEGGGVSKIAGKVLGAGSKVLTGLSSIAGPASLIMGGISMIGGAKDEAEHAKKQQIELKKGIKKIDKERSKLSSFAVKDIENLWTGLGEKLDTMRFGIGDTIDDATGELQKTVARGKGLATGEAQIQKEEMITDTEEAYQKKADALEAETVRSIDLYGRKHEESMTDINRNVQQSLDAIASLEDQTDWKKNIF